ncbi:MAG: hypothetical protein EOP54_04845 [Sphingobacteriales bacterium]|nr:MAG: hypothetical protein EOP54_04845 [Sphingobacteriales bacterium]
MIIPILLIFGLTGIVMWLWNNTLVAAVSGIAVISYWQAMGLLVLSKVLFGGFPGKGGRGGARHCRKGAWQEDTDHLSPEEKEQFKAMWQARFQRKSDRQA